MKFQKLLIVEIKIDITRRKSSKEIIKSKIK